MWRCIVTLCLLVGLPVGTAMADLTYDIEATIDVQKRRIDGTVTVHGTSLANAGEICWLLFPNRFAHAESDAGVNDFSRLLVYPEETFEAGGIAVGGPHFDGHFVEASALPRDTVWLQASEAGRTELTLNFTTTVPHRFGAFGEFEDQLTLLGGWHPMLCDATGSTAHLRDSPPPAVFNIDLTLVQPADVILNGISSPRATHVRYHSNSAEAAAALIVAPTLEHREFDVDRTHVAILRSPERRNFRIAWTSSPDERIEEAIGATLRALPHRLAKPAALTVVLAPLRAQLTSPAPGMVVLSDRVFKTNPLVQPFHELQTASAVFAHVIEPTIEQREEYGDVRWVRDAIARDWARQSVQREYPERRGVYEWIDLFNIFAIVDRFETSPRIPFVDSFFEHTAHADPLHEQLFTFNNDEVPGVVLLDKLRQAYGNDVIRRVIDDCAVGPERFADCARRADGVDVDHVVADWRPSFPQINYAIVDYDLNEPVGDGFQQSIHVRRDGERAVSEAVPIRLRGISGAPTTVVWNGRGNEATVTTHTDHRVLQALIDSDRTLIETTRADNAAPADPQLVLDAAEVEVSSTEFGFAALAALRNRYDYSKDLAAALSYSNRAASLHAGGRLHFGTAIDANSFRNNLFAFYEAHALDSSFKEKDNGGVRTAGHANGFGLRYDYSDVFESNNPKRSLHVRLFGDIFHRTLASDYDFADWGIDASATQPLWTPRTVLAAQVINGFSAAIGDSVVPLQARFSLGGSRSIRGIGAEEELARNLLVVRAELRQSIFPEFDHNFLDLVSARRLQIHAFVDAGRVSNSAGRVYDVSAFAVGAGVGIGLNYEFFGFFPAQVYVEMATRVDRSDSLGDIQVLFGTRQSF